MVCRAPHLSTDTAAACHVGTLPNTAVSTQYGRKPLVLGLAPTRELAKQVALDFESVSGRLQTLSVYGGTPMYPQVRVSPHCSATHCASLALTWYAHACYATHRRPRCAVVST